MLGILCGLEMEARLVRSLAGVKVVVSAAHPEQARRGADELVKAGATRLLSFGLCGALTPALPAGSLVIGEGVQSNNGLWAADAAWVAALKKALPDAASGLVWGSERMLDTAHLKQSLFARYQASIVDMESQFVAEAAAKADIPFSILRAVSDEAGFDLPKAACLPLKATGKPSLSALLQSLLKEPSQLGALITLGSGTRRAMRALGKACPQIKA